MQHQKPDYTFPMRLNRYLAWKGLATRKEADVLIEKGMVTVNGHTAHLGQKVIATDKVEVVKRQQKSFVYLAYHKPRGVITHSPSAGEKDIRMMLERGDLFPVGRLDKDSSGLIILTNDGRLTDRLLSPEHGHEKEYEVELDRPIVPRDIERLEKGISIEGYKTKPAKVRKITNKKLLMTLTEGKKHQIRRMLAAVGIAVRSLERKRILNIALGDLEENGYRALKGKELEVFLKEVGL